jgi:hypothetical protein
MGNFHVVFVVIATLVSKVTYGVIGHTDKSDNIRKSQRTNSGQRAILLHYATIS